MRSVAKNDAGIAWKRFGGSARQWRDWRWQQAHAISTGAKLARYLRLSADEQAGLRQARFPVRVTPYYLSLADASDAFCPIRMQVVPRLAETHVTAGEMADPLGEDAKMPVAGIVHRYPDRVLYLALEHCAVYCRHCTRRRLIGATPGKPTARLRSLSAATAYVRAHHAVRDVLISGGDPFLLATSQLERIVAAFRAVPQVEILRIGTRMPVCNPMRVTKELVTMLRRYRPLFVITHFNHPKEVTASAQEACARLVDAGIPVENQSVLIRQLNSSPRIITDLCHRLLAMRVRPYYLHQMDVAQGLEHLRTPVSQGVAIVKAMRGHTSGLAVPHFAIDLPGGGGKVTLQPEYLVSADAQQATFCNFQGDIYRYPEPANSDCRCPYEEKFYGD